MEITNINLAFKPLYALMMEQERRRHNFLIANSQQQLSVKELTLFHEREEDQHEKENNLAHNFLSKLQQAGK